MNKIILKENLYRIFFDINLSSIFLELPLKAKINKWNLIKLKIFCIAKETIDKTKSNILNGRKYLQII